MNVVKEIQAINQKELDSGSSASWHDQYKDSAYVYAGGLPNKLTEGDVITIFSQYGEVVDISLPRDPTTQKTKGFAFIMYADQRSTVLAVDNLGGSKVLDRVLRVDHVLNYKQLKRDEESGKMVEREVQSLSAHPDNFKHLMPKDGSDDEAVLSDASSHPSIDLDDPMRDYLIQQSREKKAYAKGKGSSAKRVKSSKEDKKRDRDSESKEERKERRDGKKLRLGLITAEDSKGKGKLRIEESDSKSKREKAFDYYEDDSRAGGRRDDDRRSSHRSEERDGDRSERRRSDDSKDDRNYERSRSGRDNGRDRDRDDSFRGKSSNRFADLQSWASRK